MTFPSERDPKDIPMPPATKEDYIIFLLEQLVRSQEAEQGRVERLMAWEGDLAIGGTAGDSVVIEADFPHDAWVVWSRLPAAGTSVLRVWPGGTPPASGAIEIRSNTACRLKSTSHSLHIVNAGTGAVHYFAVAVSLAEVDFQVIL